MSNIVSFARHSQKISNIAPHYHDTHQIIFIKKGLAEITVNSQKYIAEDNTLILLSRFEMHSIKILSDTYERFQIRINPNELDYGNLSSLYSVLINRPEGFCHINTVKRDLFMPIFKNIVYEFENKLEYSNEMQKSLLDELLILIYRELPHLFTSENEHNDIIIRIQQEFETNFKDDFSLEYISSKYHLNPYYLSHLFKKITGYSVMGYLKSVRISAAKRMLIKTNLSIGEIVENCGFSDISNFCRMFKNSNGLTPKEFRKKYNF